MKSTNTMLKHQKNVWRRFAKTAILFLIIAGVNRPETGRLFERKFWICFPITGSFKKE